MEFTPLSTVRCCAHGAALCRIIAVGTRRRTETAGRLELHSRKLPGPDRRAELSGGTQVGLTMPSSSLRSRQVHARAAGPGQRHRLRNPPAACPAPPPAAALGTPWHAPAL